MRRRLDAKGTGVSTKDSNKTSFYALSFNGTFNFGTLKEFDGRNSKLDKVLPSDGFEVIVIFRPYEFAKGVDSSQVSKYKNFVSSGKTLSIGMFDSGLACAVGDGSDYAIAKVALKESDMNKDMMAIISLDTSGNLNLNVVGNNNLNESDSINTGKITVVNSSDIYI